MKELFIQSIKDIILGVVQGLTEFLPVSSSGHLNIAEHLMGMTNTDMFLDVMLHVGTLVAVLIFYRKLVVRLIKSFGLLVKDVFTGKFSWKNMDNDRNLIMMLVIGLLPLFLLFAPIPGTDMKIKDLADMFKSQQYFIVTGIALLVTSVLLWLGIYFNKKMPENNTNTGRGRSKYSVLDAVTVGAGQCIAAIFPGLSRSGTTLALGEMRGINKQAALDYTFILAIPSIVAAALLEVKDLDFATIDLNMMLPVLLGVVAAAVVGYLSIVLFKWLLKTDKMIVFVVYTAIVGLLIVGVGVYELSTGSIVSFV